MANTKLLILLVLFGCASVEEGDCLLGSTKSGYKRVTDKNGKPACETATQSCVEGKWDGEAVYETCEKFK